jgi:hypothetical protein
VEATQEQLHESHSSVDPRYETTHEYTLADAERRIMELENELAVRDQIIVKLTVMLNDAGALDG